MSVSRGARQGFRRGHCWLVGCNIGIAEGDSIDGGEDGVWILIHYLIRAAEKGSTRPAYHGTYQGTRGTICALYLTVVDGPSAKEIK